MKPTFGRVSKYGAFPLSWTLDHIGPMTRTVEDNIIMLKAIAGFDPHDYFSADVPLNIDMSYVKAGVKGKTIGIPTTFYFDGLSDEVEKLMVKAIDTFQEMGAIIKKVEIPHLEEMSIAQSITIMTEAFAVHEERLRTQPEKFEEEVRNRLMPSVFVSASEYVQAQQMRQIGIREFNKALEEADVILAPSTAIEAGDIDQREVVVKGKTEAVRVVLTRMSGPANLTGFPSLSVPCGLSKDGLPVGMQLIGKAFDEATTYRFGYAFEQQSGFNTLKYDINDVANK